MESEPADAAPRDGRASISWIEADLLARRFVRLPSAEGEGQPDMPAVVALDYAV